MKKIFFACLLAVFYFDNAVTQPCVPTPLVFFDQSPIPLFICVNLCPGYVTPIQVCPDSAEGSGPNCPPLVIVTAGCYSNSRCDDSLCSPAIFHYDSSAWTIDPVTGCWKNNILGLSDGCVCVVHNAHLSIPERFSVSATALDMIVTLSWEMRGEYNQSRWDIQRDNVRIAELPAKNDSCGTSEYSYVDNSVLNGRTYGYTLIAVDRSGHEEMFETIEASPHFGSAVVTNFALLPNFPNPFNASTEIAFDLPEVGTVSLTIFNLAGQKITTLVNGTETAGRHAVHFDADNLPSGIYLCRLTVNGFSATQKMVLLK